MRSPRRTGSALLVAEDEVERDLGARLLHELDLRRGCPAAAGVVRVLRAGHRRLGPRPGRRGRTQRQGRGGEDHGRIGSSRSFVSPPACAGEVASAVICDGAVDRDVGQPGLAVDPAVGVRAARRPRPSSGHVAAGGLLEPGAGVERRVLVGEQGRLAARRSARRSRRNGPSSRRATRKTIDHDRRPGRRRRGRSSGTRSGLPGAPGRGGSASRPGERARPWSCTSAWDAWWRACWARGPAAR